jgi:hypothetical protein
MTMSPQSTTTTTATKARFETAAPPAKTRQPAGSGWVLAIALAVVVPMSGCDDAVITYKQIGLCHSYVDPNVPDLDVHSVSAPNYFVLFQIDSVDTSGSTQDFIFDPSRFIVSGGNPKSRVDTLLSSALAGPFAGAAGTFQAGQAPPALPSSFIVAALVTAAPDGNLAFSLTYADPPPGVPNPNPNLTVWTIPDAQAPPNEQQDCKDVHAMN